MMMSSLLNNESRLKTMSTSTGGLLPQCCNSSIVAIQSLILFYLSFQIWPSIRVKSYDGEQVKGAGGADINLAGVFRGKTTSMFYAPR